MVSFKILFITCKEHLKKVLSVMDDSHDYDTAVDKLMKESQEKPTEQKRTEAQEKPCSKPLYTEPSDNYIQSHPTNYNDDFAEKSEYIDEKLTASSRTVDEILESCEDLPAKVDVPSPTISTDIQEAIALPDAETKPVKSDVTVLAENQLEPVDNLSDEIAPPSDKEHLFSSLVELIEELDQLSMASNDENAQAAITFSQNRLIEILINNGCTPIENDTVYNSLCHQTKPFRLVNEDREISSYLRTGVRYQGKTLLKALVTLKEE